MRFQSFSRKRNRNTLVTVTISTSVANHQLVCHCQKSALLDAFLAYLNARTYFNETYRSYSFSLPDPGASIPIPSGRSLRPVENGGVRIFF